MTQLDEQDAERLDRWWRAANYLTVGQIYLRDNVLLREPLRPEHVKPRLLGHWGTSPGLNLLWAHLNRLIVARDLEMLFVCGPGHGGPAVVANTWLEGTWSEVYPDIGTDEAGLRRLCRQFSTPGGFPSHVSVEVPGSIHEGGELGYALVHAVGAAFDAPDRIVACVVGDGEAETGPLEGSWKGVRFLDPRRDGAVLPILHLNDGKISGPTVLGRSDDADVAALLRSHGYDPLFVEGDRPEQVHADLADALERAVDTIGENRADARSGRAIDPAVGLPWRWPAIVLRTPKGWTGPGVVDGLQVEGTFRSHQVPVNQVRTDPDHLAVLEEWMRSYRPEELFGVDGRPAPDLVDGAPRGDRRMSASPAANGGRVSVALDLPDYVDYAFDVTVPGQEYHESTRRLGEWLRDVFVRNAEDGNFRLFSPDETNSNRLGAVFDVENRCWTLPVTDDDDHLAPDGRVMEVLSEHLCHGWLEGYNLTGRHGLFATYEAFAMVSASMTVQHAKWLDAAAELGWRRPVPSLNVLLTSTCWRNDHNGFSHQGPGLIDTVISKKPEVARVYLPPDANTLLSVADHCLRSRDYVNLIVIDKQPQLQWLDMRAAREHCTRGYGDWEWAGTFGGEDPDIVLACAGDVVTMETVAAAQLLRRWVPELRVRVVNIVDLMTLLPANDHPHGMDLVAFNQLFTPDQHVVFAFHGYPRAVHFLVHGQGRQDRFHVRGYKEEGTTTTPFDMVVLNDVSRYQLCLQALRRARRRPAGADELGEHCRSQLAAHELYITEHLQDLPEVQDWTWEP
ncbi:phosphoketolase family protein [Rhabdothermincola salaria]|uniref:phosphoketolase family protein n=1 Tax=Rhabdothermincola salaria TaxID=2903142 RepID=UPI001E39114B|nr:phosphoketolase family protein [Rhabdothermincola salaria]